MDIEVTDIAELRKRKCKKVLAERDTARAGLLIPQSRGKSPGTGVLGITEDVS